MIFQEEDEKERLSQAQEAGEDDCADHTEAAEDSFLGLSIEEVQKPHKYKQTQFPFFIFNYQ